VAASSTMRILAGDIGGTKTWLAIYDHDGALTERRQARFPSREYPGLEPILAEFLGDEGVDAAGFGIAGPVEGREVELTNLPWAIDADALDLPRVRLVNDFAAVALGLDALEEHSVLQEGVVSPGGPKVIVGAGTGLGEAIRVGDVVLASEGGHVDFAPTDDVEIALLQELRADLQRVSVERVVSGLGLETLYAFLARRGDADPEVTRAVDARGGEAITEAATKGDPIATETLRRFVRLYGVEAGNLALKVLPTGGFYIAGGIAPKLQDALGDEFRERFLDGFHDKGRMRPVQERARITLIRDPKIGLKGAALAALL